VLTLLRPEFPDITISKIRFLESQGLVSPQRSPSGYRKFYDEDVERLRYVLVQQREHFLPLKVIRDRLNGVETEEPEENGHAVVVEEIIETTTESVVSVREVVEVVSAPRHVAAKEPSLSDVVSAMQEGPTRSGRHAASSTRQDPQPDVEEVEKEVDHGTTLSISELAIEAHLTEDQISALVEFGILDAVSVGGMMCFNDDNVAVARIAAGFAEFGVEPRHLKQFRLSAEREAGMIDQLVAPLLRQRKPESRAKASASAKALAKLGREMRATLVAQEIKAIFKR
jgi:DNA-binding transcriptional MerR regulator